MAKGSRITAEVAIGDIDSIDDAASTTIGTAAIHIAIVDTADGARQRIAGSYLNAGT